MSNTYDWERCDHSGIGMPGCPVCDPDKERCLIRAQRHDNRDLRAQLAAEKARADAAESALAALQGDDDAWRKTYETTHAELLGTRVAHEKRCHEITNLGNEVDHLRQQLAGAQALAEALAEIERWEQPGASWARELAAAALAVYRRGPRPPLSSQCLATCSAPCPASTRRRCCAC